jgi:hypothetical protein
MLARQDETPNRGASHDPIHASPPMPCRCMPSMARHAQFHATLHTSCTESSTRAQRLPNGPRGGNLQGRTLRAHHEDAARRPPRRTGRRASFTQQTLEAGSFVHSIEASALWRRRACGACNGRAVVCKRRARARLAHAGRADRGRHRHTAPCCTGHTTRRIT